MPAVDEGLLSPVTADSDAEVTDAAVASALVAAEVALSRAWAAVGSAPDAAAAAISAALGWAGPGAGCDATWLSVSRLTTASVAGGNPVIPLVGMLRDRVPVEARAWVHRGATSQDILDSALMLVARRAGREALQTLRATESLLAGFAVVHRDEVAAARTLTQHAVPTTTGARAATWLRGVTRARVRLAEAVGALPAQLGGAGGTLASFVEMAGADVAAALPAAYAAELGLAAPAAPWHVTRWPVTELGDALVQAIDAAGKVAADVATLSRTEIGELSEGAGGGSSAMPQKQNPAASVLLRSAALRAPQLGATLHLAAGFAVDERPDGAWHAEWPTLRELLRLTLGATATLRRLVEGLRVDAGAVALDAGLTDGLIVAERLSIVLTPVLGKDEVTRLVTAAGAGGDLAALVRESLEAAVDRAPGAPHPADDVEALLDPANYTGLAGLLVDRAVADAPADAAGAAAPAAAVPAAVPVAAAPASADDTITTQAEPGAEAPAGPLDGDSA